MIIIVEGMDRCGKSTIVSKIQNELYERVDKPVVICHYKNIVTKKQNIFDISKNHYQAGFDFIEKNYLDYNLIFDRFHIGEVVYSPIYRSYSGNYVFNYEKKCVENIGDNIIKLIVVVDSINRLLTRDDGMSLSIDFNNKLKEQINFIKAFHQSIIKQKILIDISEKNYTLDEVVTLSKEFIFNEN